MNHPLVIIIASMLVGLVILIGLGAAINRMDDWLRQREAPVSLKRWPPVVKDLGNNIIEVAIFGNARWDQVPMLMLGGFFVVAILMSFPVPGQTPLFVMGKIGLVLILFGQPHLRPVDAKPAHSLPYRFNLGPGATPKQTFWPAG